jgi:hypothetical protein
MSGMISASMDTFSSIRSTKSKGQISSSLPKSALMSPIQKAAKTPLRDIETLTYSPRGSTGTLATGKSFLPTPSKIARSTSSSIDKIASSSLTSLPTRFENIPKPAELALTGESFNSSLTSEDFIQSDSLAQESFPGNIERTNTHQVFHKDEVSPSTTVEVRRAISKQASTSQLGSPELSSIRLENIKLKQTIDSLHHIRKEMEIKLKTCLEHENSLQIKIKDLGDQNGGHESERLQDSLRYFSIHLPSIISSKFEATKLEAENIRLHNQKLQTENKSLKLELSRIQDDLQIRQTTISLIQNEKTQTLDTSRFLKTDNEYLAAENVELKMQLEGMAMALKDEVQLGHSALLDLQAANKGLTTKLEEALRQVANRDLRGEYEGKQLEMEELKQKNQRLADLVSTGEQEIQKLQRDLDERQDALDSSIKETRMVGVVEDSLRAEMVGLKKNLQELSMALETETKTRVDTKAQMQIQYDVIVVQLEEALRATEQTRLQNNQLESDMQNDEREIARLQGELAERQAIMESLAKERDSGEGSAVLLHGEVELLTKRCSTFERKYLEAQKLLELNLNDAEKSKLHSRRQAEEVTFLKGECFRLNAELRDLQGRLDTSLIDSRSVYQKIETLNDDLHNLELKITEQALLIQEADKREALFRTQSSTESSKLLQTNDRLAAALLKLRDLARMRELELSEKLNLRDMQVARLSDLDAAQATLKETLHLANNELLELKAELVNAKQSYSINESLSSAQMLHQRIEDCHLKLEADLYHGLELKSHIIAELLTRYQLLVTECKAQGTLISDLKKIEFDGSSLQDKLNASRQTLAITMAETGVLQKSFKLLEAKLSTKDMEITHLINCIMEILTPEDFQSIQMFHSISSVTDQLKFSLSQTHFDSLKAYEFMALWRGLKATIIFQSAFQYFELNHHFDALKLKLHDGMNVGSNLLNGALNFGNEISNLESLSEDVEKIAEQYGIFDHPSVRTFTTLGILECAKLGMVNINQFASRLLVSLDQCLWEPPILAYSTSCIYIIGTESQKMISSVEEIYENVQKQCNNMSAISEHSFTILLENLVLLDTFISKSFHVLRELSQSVQNMTIPEPRILDASLLSSEYGCSNEFGRMKERLVWQKGNHSCLYHSS